MRWHRAANTILLLITFIVGRIQFAAAQQSTTLHHIGYLSPTSPSVSPGRIAAFRQGLRELGYVEGNYIVIEYRYAEGKFDRLSTLAAELVRLKVELIVTTGPTVTRAAKEATATVPVVMTTDTDPVGNGIIANLARPAGNITGLSSLAPELSGKQLELLKEIVPSSLASPSLGLQPTLAMNKCLKRWNTPAARSA